MRLRVISRLLQIQRVLVRHGLDEVILATHLFRPLRFAFYLSPATWLRRHSSEPRAVKIRLALEELGPIQYEDRSSIEQRQVQILPVWILNSQETTMSCDLPPCAMSRQCRRRVPA